MKDPRDRYLNQDGMEKLPTLNDIKNQERLDIMASELVSCKSKRQIVKEYSEKWQCAPTTIQAIIRDTIAWMASTSKTTADEYRVLNTERLDSLLDEADRVGDKIKILDLINKTNNVYETKVQIGNKEDEVIKLDIGV
jgi:hypothetical protein